MHSDENSHNRILSAFKVVVETGQRLASGRNHLRGDFDLGRASFGKVRNGRITIRGAMWCQVYNSQPNSGTDGEYPGKMRRGYCTPGGGCATINSGWQQWMV